MGAGSWKEIEVHEAREKVSHALRDRVREQQSQPNVDENRSNHLLHQLVL